MTQAKELDLGPLTWVKSEIDLALARAAESLGEASRTSDAAARIQFAQTHLHQVRGALSIVGLDGLTQFATGVDQLFGAMSRGEAVIDEHSIELAGRALSSIGNYLEELAHGTPDQPLRLLPLYREIVAARGIDAPSAADLFFPDTSLRAPRRQPSTPLAADARQTTIRGLRARFQRGLLEWIRTPTAASGPESMRSALDELESIEPSAPARALWWVGQAVVDTLHTTAEPDRIEIKRLLSRIEAQLRRAGDTPQPVPERLLREMLYQVATQPALTSAQQAVRDNWQLDTMLPEAGARVSELPLAPLLQDLRSRLSELKEEWDTFSAGTAIALQRFDSALDEFSVPVSRLGRPAVDRLVAGIRRFTAWLRKDPLHFSEAIAIEMATALLLAEAALDRSVPDAGFSEQVNEAIERLDTLSRGEQVAAVDSSPGLEAARRAQEKEALGHVSREILSSLANIEQTLDDFFRDQRKRAPLAQLSAPLHQIEGALSLLGENDAIELVHAAGETIAGFAQDDSPADSAEFEALAHQLSALGFFVQSLQHGKSTLQQFLNIDAAGPAAQVDEPVAPTPAPDAGIAAPETAAVPEAGTPTEADSEEITLEDAEALEVAAASGPDESQTTAPPAVPPVADDTRRLMESSDEEIDAELLCIFIEEAHEVLATVAEQLELSRTEPANGECLTAIRRGFHTLKGSGRMVGLRDFGEASWALEQTLNRWLQLEWPPTSALHHLIDEAHQHFTAWVLQLEAGGAHYRDVSALLAEAARLNESAEPTQESAVGQSAPIAPPAETGSNADIIETTLDFDLTLSEDGEILPFSAEAEAPDYLPEETSLEDFPFIDADTGIELAHDASDTIRDTTTDIESDEQVLSADDGANPISAPDLELSEVEELDFDATLPPVDETQDDEDTPLDLLQITALDETWMPPEDMLEAAEAPADPSSGMETPPDLLQITALDKSWLPAEDMGEPEHTSAADDDRMDALSDIGPDTETAGHDGTDEQEPGAEAPVPVIEPEPEPEPEPAEFAPDAPGTEKHVAETAAASEAQEDADFVRIDDVEISRPLYDLYVAEARHHIATLHQEFARLKANPTLQLPEVALRAAHTFAGISGTARISPLHTLARALEHAEQRLRDQSAAPSAGDLALFRTSVDTLEAMLAEVVGKRMPLDVPGLVEQLEHACRHPNAPARAAAPDVATVADSVAPAQTPDEALATRVSDEIDEQLLPIFLDEAGELLSELHAALRNWQSDTSNADHPKSVARLLHTLKGSARMAGAMQLGEQIHQLESRLEASLKSGRETPALIEELVTSLDHTEQMIDGLASGETHLAPETPDTQKTAADSGPAVSIDTTAGEADSAAASGTLRVRAELVDRFVNEAGEIGVARTRIEGELRNLRRSMLDLTENVIRLRNQLREVEIQADVQMQSRMAQAESRHAEFDPLEMDRYTRLQELTRMMAESVNDVTTVQQSLLKNLDGADIALHSQARLSRELQQSLMQVRMVPFDSLADRLYRIVRKGTKELGKRANLDLRGGRIEVDRSVLEHMVAPLEHLLRNSLAHGIEAPEKRRAAGKPEIGQITLSVSQEGNEIVLELADDGAGLDFERIAAKAHANGLLAADETADERRLTNLIFVPGFSTAGTVSAVSGRGVGMDVVKAETAAVGGRIDVSSAPDAGTVFRIYLPLTLAVTQALLVRAAGRHFAIPSSMVAQVMELKADALERLRKDGGTDWMDQHYAYRYLPRLLGDQVSQPEIQRYNWVLLLRAGAQTLALHVDALRGNQEIIVKNAGPQLTRIVGMSGATVLGDGEIVLILNPVALASRGLAGNDMVAVTVADELPPQPAPEPLHVPTVMVVDDSLTVRKITSRLLEREGYRVITAKDGVDALEALIETVPDVMLCDIEMPRMDGFDLVRNIRADERTKAVPVIMITSRLADKHRSYAMEIGANHYLGKPYQEEALLGLIAGYTRRD